MSLASMILYSLIGGVVFVLFILLIFGLCKAAARADEWMERQHAQNEAWRDER